MHKQQLSLFPEESESTISPEWKFPQEPHTDYISDDPVSVVAFCFDVAILERIASFYSTPPYKALMAGLRDLSRCSDSNLRNSIFTIYAGDSLEMVGAIFVVAIETESPELTDFLARYFRNVSGYIGVEASSSRDLIPTFRYDSGFIIHYSDPELAGTSSKDNDDWYGSGLTIFHRQCKLPEDIGKRKSCYARLVRRKRKRLGSQ